MYVSNIDIIKSRVLKCGKPLADYVVSRNIPLLNLTDEEYSFIFTDLLEEVVDMRPKELRKEGFSIE